MPFQLLRSGQYYEPFSPQQPPLLEMYEQYISTWLYSVRKQSHYANCICSIRYITVLMSCVWYHDHPSIHPSMSVWGSLDRMVSAQPPLPSFLSPLLPRSSGLCHSHLWLLIPHFSAGTEKQTSCMARCHMSQRNKAAFVCVLAVSCPYVMRAVCLSTLSCPVLSASRPSALHCQAAHSLQFTRRQG
jgi:hypothetical protein